ncbi:MAG: hypothetical protein ABIN58_02460 [candidate division WOR-3 bacterium]
MSRGSLSWCAVLLCIVLGVVFLTHTSLIAQDTSAIRERERFVSNMKTNLNDLEACMQWESRLAQNRSRLEKYYQDYREKEEVSRQAKADFDRAAPEVADAVSAAKEANDQYSRMSERCERLKQMTGLDWKEIPECVDAERFYGDVVVPRGEHSYNRQKWAKYDADRYLALADVAEKAEEVYNAEVRKVLDITASRYVRTRPPDEWKDELHNYCDRLRSYRQKDIQRASEITHLLATDCRFNEANQFVSSLPDYQGKSELVNLVSAAKKQEDDAAAKYKEANDLYRQGQVEERAGNFLPAADRYRGAIQRLEEGRSMTKCPNRPEQFDKAIEKTRVALARLSDKATAGSGQAKPKSSACAVPQDCAAQKRALHARIIKGNTFRKDGGGGWHPTSVQRAGYAVGSESLPATAAELAAMTTLISGYEGCSANYWAVIEGEVPQLTKARDDAYKRKDPATGQRLNEEIGRRKDEAARTYNNCIKRNDETFKAAMDRAREACKK